MNEFEILYRGKFYSLYSQVALFDAEAKDAYPEWKAGKEIIVFGLHGVAVVTANDKQIEVIVCQGRLIPEYAICISGEIIVGNKGIVVGNIPAGTIVNLSLISGRYSIVIFTDAIGIGTNQVYFVVNRMNQ